MSRGKWVIVLAAVASIMGCAAAQRQANAPQVVRAQRFELVDAKGEVRAALVVDTEGDPDLTFWDDAGRPRASLGLVDQRPLLVLCDKRGRQRAALMLAANDAPVLIACDENAKPIAGLGLLDDDGPVLLLSGRQAEAVWTAP